MAKNSQLWVQAKRRRSSILSHHERVRKIRSGKIRQHGKENSDVRINLQQVGQGDNVG
jgi:hypothetical protein